VTEEKDPKSSAKFIERWLALAAVVLLLAAWITGKFQAETGIAPYLSLALPGAERFEPLAEGIYVGKASSANGERIIGYAADGQASGYGGPLKVAVGIDPQGKILGVAVISQRENPYLFQQVRESNYLGKFAGKSYSDPFQPGNDIDVVSGASYASRGILEAVKLASRKAAARQLGADIPPEPAPAIQFGPLEGILILLFAAGYIGHRRQFKYTRLLRWGTMLTGLATLGFLYNNPLTLAYINSLLLGFWPAWQTHLYWYILLGGIFFVFTIDNKNPYCEWFCPFGAAQECLARVAGAHTSARMPYRQTLVWLQRGLAFSAILLALFFRNPSLSSYEIFGMMFRLAGSKTQLILLVLVLILALFIRRPWCSFLCPLHPVDEFIRLVRGWMIELWQKRIRGIALKR
jgi:NosR/NirI family transcriptional regulator, nitrous oxide reductase regulator